MYTTSNEIILESVEIDLLVTEGLAVKSKKVLAEAIKKIKEFIRKVLSYIKSKLGNKTKAVDVAIKEVKANKAETTEEPVNIAGVKKLTNLVEAVELALKTGRNVVFSTANDLDKLLDNITDDYEILDSLYEKYKGNVDEAYTGNIMSVVNGYTQINARCEDLLDSIKRCSNDLEMSLKAISGSEHELAPKKMQLITKTQATITKAITATEFVINACQRSVNTLQKM